MTARVFSGRVLVGFAFVFLVGAAAAFARQGASAGAGTGGLSVVAALLFLQALRLRDEWRTGAAIVALTTLPALWAGDALLGMIPESPDAGRLARAAAAGVVPDPRSMLEVVGSLRSRGADAWPTVYAGNSPMFQGGPYPLASISGVTSVMCRERYFVVYRTDRYGFPNPPQQWDIAPPMDLALVGDSYVLGWCVRPRDTFAAAIRGRYPSTIVLGHGASGPLTQLAQMREYLGPLRPRRVLWFYYEGNDLPDLTAEGKNPMLRRYLEQGFTQRLTARQPELDSLMRAVATADESTTVVNDRARNAPATPASFMRASWSTFTLSHMREWVTRLRKPPGRRPCCDLALFRTVVGAMQATVAEWGGTITMIYLPSEHRIAGRPPLSTLPAEMAGDSAVAIAGSFGIPVVDLRAAVPRYGTARDLYVYDNGHLTEQGYRAVSELVLDYLARSAAPPGIGQAPREPGHGGPGPN